MIDVAKWAEVQRLKKVENLSNREIARRVGCCHKTVATWLKKSYSPLNKEKKKSKSILDPFKPKIDELISDYPTLSAVRVQQEIAKCGFKGGYSIVKRYLQEIRPCKPKKIYLETNYEPGSAIQVDWGDCGKCTLGDSARKIYVFSSVLCYSRLMYIEFSLSCKKEDFYRCIVNALHFYGGSPKRIIVDNLKAAVIDGAGKNAKFHPEFLSLCGHFLIKPVACPAYYPQGKGKVESSIKYLKNNCLAGYSEKLKSLEDYHKHAIFWRDEVANIRLHSTTRKRPIDMFTDEQEHLTKLPEITFDTDIVAPVIASPMARVTFDCNKYSVPPAFTRKSLTLRANEKEVKIFDTTTEVAKHIRCYEKGKSIVEREHHKQVLALKRKEKKNQIEIEFDSLGEKANLFRLELNTRPGKSALHLKNILRLALIYGQNKVYAAIEKALEFNTLDSAYIENLVVQQHRRENLPTPTILNPIRKEVLEETVFEQSDLSIYDDLFDI